MTRRKKHLHCRCSDCHGLKEVALAGFVKGSHRLQEFVIKRDLHNDAIKGWLGCQKYWEERGMHSPQDVNVIEYDDTGAVYFPHFTQRVFKESSQLQGVGFVPWMVEDKSRGKRTYVYSRKGRWEKGRNRFCTQMLRCVQGYGIVNIMYKVFI